MKIKYSIGEDAEISVWELNQETFPTDCQLERKAESLVRDAYEGIDSGDVFDVFFLYPLKGWIHYSVDARIVLELDAWRSDPSGKSVGIIEELNNAIL